MSDTSRELILSDALALREREQGEPARVLDRAKVPAAFQDLFLDAQALGASDEALHGPLAELLTKEYVDHIVERIGSQRAELSRWINAGPANDEKAAFVSLEMVLDRF